MRAVLGRARLAVAIARQPTIEAALRYAGSSRGAAAIRIVSRTLSTRMATAVHCTAGQAPIATRCWIGNPALVHSTTAFSSIPGSLRAVAMLPIKTERELHRLSRPGNMRVTIDLRAAGVCRRVTSEVPYAQLRRKPYLPYARERTDQKKRLKPC